MQSPSPSQPSFPLQQPRLISSIGELGEAIKNAGAEADRIETQIAYKDAEIEELKSARISAPGSTTQLDHAISHAQDERQKLWDTFDAKRDEVAALKGRLGKREARLAAIPPVESTDAPDPKDNEEAAALLEITATPKSDIFITSDDDETFISPVMLRGVPTYPISEDGTYWKSSWTKFGDAIDENSLQRQHDQDIELKREKTRHAPLSENEIQYFEEQDKRYQSHLNQVRVIKKWFCPGRTMHPNQLLAKEHMPDKGLCRRHVLYEISNILRRLNALYERGELRMQPLYFLLWRMSVSFDRRPPVARASLSKNILDEHHHFFDDTLRQAVLRGAQHMHEYNFYRDARAKGWAATSRQPTLFPTAASEQNTRTQAPKLPTTLLRGNHGPQLAHTLTSVATASSETSDSSAPSSPAKQMSTRASGRKKSKRRRSLAAVAEQASEEDGSELPPAKKPSRPTQRLEMRVPIRSKSSAENLIISDEGTAQQSEGKTKNQGSRAAQMPDIERKGQKSRGLDEDMGRDRMAQKNTKGKTRGPEAVIPGMFGEVVAEKRSLQAHEMLPNETITEALPGDEAGDINDDQEGNIIGRVLTDEGRLSSHDGSDVKISEARPGGGKPYPMNRRRVSHGFLIPWLPCTEREALESYI